jgi:16S rRNA (uracil1498-N3)-methyltransferase
MHRFFVSPGAVQGRVATLVGDQARQVRRVLRMQPGDGAVLLDGSGAAYDVVLAAYDQDAARFEITGKQAAGGEPGLHIALYQAVLKGERFDWALQKGVEVGVSRFVPVMCERSVAEAGGHKHERWQRIIREAAEQSGRGVLPDLRPVQPFRDAVRAQSAELRLIAWEGERAFGLRAALAGCNLEPGVRIQVFIGPEGGFTDEEIELARQYAVQPVTLGPRVLRAETAGPVAVALILYAAGEI